LIIKNGYILTTQYHMSLDLIKESNKMLLVDIAIAL